MKFPVYFLAYYNCISNFPCIYPNVKIISNYIIFHRDYFLSSYRTFINKTESKLILLIPDHFIKGSQNVKNFFERISSEFSSIPIQFMHIWLAPDIYFMQKIPPGRHRITTDRCLISVRFFRLITNFWRIINWRRFCNKWPVTMFMQTPEGFDSNGILCLIISNLKR